MYAADYLVYARICAYTDCFMITANLFHDNKGLLIVPGGGTGCPMAWDKMSQGVGQILSLNNSVVAAQMHEGKEA